MNQPLPNQRSRMITSKPKPIFQLPLTILSIVVFSIIFIITHYFFTLALPNTFANALIIYYFELTTIYLSVSLLIVWVVLRFLFSRRKSLQLDLYPATDLYLKVSQLSPEAVERAAKFNPVSMVESLPLVEPEPEIIEPEVIVEVPPADDVVTAQPLVSELDVIELKDASFAETAKAFDQYMAENGYQSEVGISLISTMVFSKVLVMGPTEHQHDLMNLIPGFFAGNTIIIDAVNGMYGSQATIQDQPSFEALLKSAISAPNQPHWIQIRNLDVRQVSTMLGSLTEYVQFPRHTQTLTIGTETYTLPNNIWFLISFQKDQFIYQVDMHLLPYLGLLTPSVEAKDVEARERRPKAYQIDFKKASRILGPTSTSKQLPEDVWKKVDQWTAFMNNINQYVLPNDINFRFENYLISYLSMDDNPIKAVDSGLASSLLIHAISRSKPSAYQNQQDLEHFFTSTFGRNTMKQSLSMVKQYLNSQE
jgi:hypothetical protein